MGEQHRRVARAVGFDPTGGDFHLDRRPAPTSRSVELLSGGSPTAFDPSANSSVATLAVSEPVLCMSAASSPRSQGRHATRSLPQYGLYYGSATAWNPDATANANVLTIAICGLTIYAYGEFTPMHGVNCKNISGASAPPTARPQALIPRPATGALRLRPQTPACSRRDSSARSAGSRAACSRSSILMTAAPQASGSRRRSRVLVPFCSGGHV